MLAVGAGRDLDRREALAGQAGSPVVAQERGQLRKVILLDQEVRAGASTLAGARRAADERRDAGVQAAIA